MAFNIDCRLIGYEVRGVGTGTSRAGNPFRTVRIESPDGSKTNEISVTKPELFASVDQLRKGFVCNFDVAAVAGPKRSFLILTTAPVVVSDEVQY